MQNHTIIRTIKGDITKVDFVDKHPDAFDEILWVLFNDDAKEAYDQAVSRIA